MAAFHKLPAGRKWGGVTERAAFLCWGNLASVEGSPRRCWHVAGFVGQILAPSGACIPVAGTWRGVNEITVSPDIL